MPSLLLLSVHFSIPFLLTNTNFLYVLFKNGITPSLPTNTRFLYVLFKNGIFNLPQQVVEMGTFKLFKARLKSFLKM